MSASPSSTVLRFLLAVTGLTTTSIGLAQVGAINAPTPPVGPITPVIDPNSIATADNGVAHTLAIAGRGRVTLNGRNCVSQSSEGKTCVMSIPPGAKVSLASHAGTGFIFDGWTGSCKPPLADKLNSAKCELPGATYSRTIKASFVPGAALVIRFRDAIPSRVGWSVTPFYQSLECDNQPISSTLQETVCSTVYPLGTTLQIRHWARPFELGLLTGSPTPIDASSMAGDCAGASGPQCILVLTGPKTVTLKP